MTDSDLPPISSRAVDGYEWKPGAVPWIRAVQSATFGEPGVGYAVCLFCGATTLKLSLSDVEVDSGRLTVYCDNMNCEAREIEIVVTRDAHDALRRADVRALKAIDGGRATEIPRPPGKLVVMNADSPSPDAARLADRRTTRVSQTLPIS